MPLNGAIKAPGHVYHTAGGVARAGKKARGGGKGLGGSGADRLNRRIRSLDDCRPVRWCVMPQPPATSGAQDRFRQRFGGCWCGCVGHCGFLVDCARFISKSRNSGGVPIRCLLSLPPPLNASSPARLQYASPCFAIASGGNVGSLIPQRNAGKSVPTA